jgi:uncharacterized membrane protein
MDFLQPSLLHVSIFRMGFSNIFVTLSEKLEFMTLYRFIMIKLILNGLSEIKVTTTC